MTQAIAAIQNFLLSFNLVEPPFSSPTKSTPISQALQFSQLTNLLMKEGSYTPNGDYEWMWQSIPAGEAPNLVFFQSPLPCNLSVRAAGQLIVNAVAVDQVFFLLLPTGHPPITDIYLEGRTDQAVMPMAQGQAVPYLCLAAKVTRL